MNLNGMVSMWKVRELVDKATNIVMNYTDTEAKVREATNDDPWGPSGQQMQEISSFTFTYEAFPEAMGMLWKRMFQDNKQNWRRVYKSLLLLDYLIKNGSERVVTSAREHLYDLRSLENYTFVDEMGKDQGINIRHKVTDMMEFIQDDDRLRDERKKAKKNKDKYVGMSSDAMGFRSGGGGGSWDSGWRSTTSNSSATGGRFDSDDDDDKRSEQSASGVSEFKDDDNDFGKKSPRGGGLPRKPSGGRLSDFTAASQRSTSTSSATSAGGVKKSSKPSRKVDLGAAAEFANKAKMMEHKSRVTENNNQIIEFFAEPGGNPSITTTSPSDYTAIVDDDFNPRADETQAAAKPQPGKDSMDLFGVNNNAKSNDDFADFSSAFADSSSSVGAAPSSTDDFFGNFSAGGGTTAIATPAAGGLDLFGDSGVGGPSSMPTPVVTPSNNVTAQGGAGLDLFGGPPTAGGGVGPAAASSMDLLGGLDFAGGAGNHATNSMPPPVAAAHVNNTLIGATSPSLLGGGMSSLPTLQPATASASALLASSSSHPAAATSNGVAAKPAVNVGDTWKDLGNLNNKLLNFSLTPETTKTASLPMNAMPVQVASNNSQNQFIGTSLPGGQQQPALAPQTLTGLDSLL
eukprot:TRINITY_DN26584_c0_g1_i1.p1 TRINITY_DN26584_c0_g1~~TRINITY_DN26584_c0_g1_i1.p1  ORF type:complete len:645 (+),score=183.98 TRINITY_DN26584_c0_g1_i1:47-1936(+)